MATLGSTVVSQSIVQNTIPGRTPLPKPSSGGKSLFSVANGQSLRSQASDLTLVLRWMVHTTYHSPSPTQFAVDYILNPRLKNDRFVVAFGLPALAGTPRVLSEAPSVRSSVSEWTYHGERTAQARKGVVNVASYNYLGFVDLNQSDRELLEYAVRFLPLAGDQDGGRLKLEKAVERELSQYFGMHDCILTASGYSINLVAFPAMARDSLADLDGLPAVFLMDSESHSSMFVGAYIACAQTSARIVKFRHNDVDDLQRKLESMRDARPNGTSRHIWVCVEGLYSMDGTVAPLPEIVALKHTYGFRVYVDEAHSLLSIGHSGRGVVEHSQDAQGHAGQAGEFSDDDVDMLGGTMSKSFSSVGGFVLFRQDSAPHVHARVREMSQSDISSISTLSLIRTLQILGRPLVIAERLAHLHRISEFVAQALSVKGYNVSTTPGGPFIALILDNVNRVLEFLRVGRELGLLCCGAAYPAAPRGAPRIRLSLTGAHTWQDIDDILRLIDEVSARIRVRKRNTQSPIISHKPVSAKKAMATSATDMDHDRCAELSKASNATILASCPPPIQSGDAQANLVRQAGAEVLVKHGVGAAGPRWMCGTTSSHMTLERLLNTTICACANGLQLEEIATTLFTDASVGLLSIVSVSMESLANRRAKKGEKHLVFLPEHSKCEYSEGASASSRNRSTITHWYTTLRQTTLARRALPPRSERSNQVKRLPPPNCMSPCTSMRTFSTPRRRRVSKIRLQKHLRRL